MQQGKTKAKALLLHTKIMLTVFIFFHPKTTLITPPPMYIHNTYSIIDIHYGFEKIGQAVENCWNWTKEVITGWFDCLQILSCGS